MYILWYQNITDLLVRRSDGRILLVRSISTAVLEEWSGRRGERLLRTSSYRQVHQRHRGWQAFATRSGVFRLLRQRSSHCQSQMFREKGMWNQRTGHRAWTDNAVPRGTQDVPWSSLFLCSRYATHFTCTKCCSVYFKHMKISQQLCLLWPLQRTLCFTAWMFVCL